MQVSQIYKTTLEEKYSKIKKFFFSLQIAYNNNRNGDLLKNCNSFRLWELGYLVKVLYVIVKTPVSILLNTL